LQMASPGPHLVQKYIDHIFLFYFFIFMMTSPDLHLVQKHVYLSIHLSTYLSIYPSI
jgi:hypothetical protein